MESKFKVYLCGKMGGVAVKQMLEERADAAVALIKDGFEIADPAAGEMDLLSTVKEVPLTYSQPVMDAIIEKDEMLIKDSNALLVLTGDTPSDGSWWEMGLAYYWLGMPIVAIAPKRKSGDLVGWTNSRVDYLAWDLKDAINWLKQYRALKEERDALHSTNRR